MNLADLGAVLTVLSAAISGTVAARQHGTGWTSLVFASAGTIGGLALGLPVAFVGGAIAYSALDRIGRSGLVMSGVFTLIYCVVPLLSIVLATAATMLLTETLLG